MSGNLCRCAAYPNMLMRHIDTRNLERDQDGKLALDDGDLPQDPTFETEQEQQARESEKALDQALARLPPG